MPRRRRPPRPGALTDLSPFRIATQIVILQFAYYATSIIILVFTALTAGKTMSLDLILDWHTLRGDVTEGWMFGLAWMLNSLASVIFLLVLIARSKLVPDFAITIHLLHLIITSLYSHSIPAFKFWWALQIASATLMTFGGIWTCQWRELQPIKFGGAADGNAQSSNGVQGGRVSEEDVGSERGHGKGRGRDGAGEYEMVPVKEGRQE